MQKDVVKDTNDVIPEVIKPKSFIDRVLSFFVAIGSAISSFFVGIYRFIFGGNNKTEIKEENTVSDSIDYDTIDVDYFIPFLKSKTLRKLNKLFHQEDDIQVILEPSKYTYDYTSENPLILSNYDSNYTYLNDRLLEDSKSNKSYLYDGKYSISEVISKDNTLSLRYDIYGNILTPLSQEDKTFSYNTLEYTPQNNLYYVKARYYDPSLSSFISKDTYLGNIYKPITTNRYAYCSGDPVNNMDLNGHKITNNKEAKAAGYNNYKDYLDAQKYYNKQSNGGKKTSNNVTPSGAYTSDGFDGGSSYHYVPPPPNPVEKYIPKLFLSIKANVSSAHDSIKNTLSAAGTSIKSIATNNTLPKSVKLLGYATTAVCASKCITETIANSCNNIARDAFNALPEGAQTTLRFVSDVVDKTKEVLAVQGILVTTIGAIFKKTGSIKTGGFAYAGGGSSGGGIVISAIGEVVELAGLSMVAVASLPSPNLPDEEETYKPKYDNPTNGKISDEEYDRLRDNSVYNKDAEEYMLGKFNVDGKSYIEEAGDKYKYFDMGYDWDRLTNVYGKYGMTKDEMFESFNKPFIQEGIDKKAPFNFSHDPLDKNYYYGSLKKEFDMLYEAGYRKDPTNPLRYILPN